MICGDMLHVVICCTMYFVMVCDVWCPYCLMMSVLSLFISELSYSWGKESWLILKRTAPCPGWCLLTFGLSFYPMIYSQSSVLQHCPIWYSSWNQLGKSLNVAFNNTESNGAMHVFDCMKIFTINILIIEKRNTKQFRMWWL